MEVEIRRSIPFVTVCMIALNIVIWLVLELLGDTEDGLYMMQHGAAYMPLIVEEGEYWRLISCMFLHFGAEHLMNNMLILGLTGMRLEYTMGSIRFGILYLLSGLCGSLLSLAGDMRRTDSVISISAGASGAVFGVIGGLLAWAVLHKGKVEGLTTKGLFGMAALSLYFGFTSGGVDNLGHIGGLIGGFLLGCIFSFESKMRKKIDFRDENSYTIDQW